MIDKFKAIFKGLDRAYGQWSNERARTIRGEVPDAMWGAHLVGKIGIGIVPIQSGNICEFGAIDIDVTTVDHKALAAKIQEYGLPLLVCKSKSGGAHCYTFTKPIKASVMRARLSRFAARLSHGKAEIFPKQDELMSPGDIGNWINLPYFKDERGCVDYNGKILTLEEFINAAETLKDANDLASVAIGVDDMPPCLQYFQTQGGSEGSRNEILYNFGIFYKKSNPDKWEDDIMEANFRIFDKPLPTKEVQALIKSLQRKSYQYKCKLPPISDFCDALTCKTLPFGIDDTGANGKYGDLMVGSICKIMTNPPRWVIEVNGVNLEFTTEEIMDYRKVRVLCMERVDIIAPPMRPEDWLQILKNRMTTKQVIEAPSDASQHSYVEYSLNEFIQMADRARGREDLLRGIPVSTEIMIKIKNEIENTETEELKKAIVFRSYDFLSYMKRKKINVTLTGPALWMELRKLKCDHTKIRIGHRTVQVWYVLLLELPKESITPEIKEVLSLIHDDNEAEI